jgi:pimeloyl-ACP methyl ester carboxylesterase
MFILEPILGTMVDAVGEYRSGGALTVDDDGVTIQQLRMGSGAHVLLANGFLSQSVTGWDRWKRAITERYPSHPVSRVRWEAQVLESLKPLVAAIDTGGDRAKLFAEAKRQLSNPLEALKAGKRPDLPVPALLIEAPAKWSIAKQRATETGVALAEAIKQTDDAAKFILTGFSLGARVMATAALTLAEQGIHHKLEAVHLVGAAISRSEKWKLLPDAVTDGVWNYYSQHDSVLSTLYRIAEAGATPFGLAGMDLDNPKAHDVDVSNEVFNHRGYLPAISLQ